MACWSKHKSVLQVQPAHINKQPEPKRSRISTNGPPDDAGLTGSEVMVV